MEIKTEVVNNVTLVTLKGRLDITTHGQLETELNGLAGKGVNKVLVDAAGLEYISSAGLRVLLAAAKNFRKVQGSIGLTSLTPTVKQVFEISGFTSIFPIYASKEEALGAMK